MNLQARGSLPLGVAEPIHSAARIFPLRLTPFEEYMFLDAQLGSRMTFLLQMKLVGPIDRGAFETASAFATSRHPLCRAIITSERWRPKSWSIEPELKPAIFWNHHANAPSAWSDTLDLTREPGLRLLVEERDTETTVTAQFHHACCDGVGALHWIDDLLVAYARLTSMWGEPPIPATLNVERLLDRQRHRRNDFRGPRWLEKAVRELYKFYVQIPAPLRANSSGATSDGAPRRLGFTSHRLSIEETKRLRAVAQAAKVSVNDLLVRDLLATIAHWNTATFLHGDPWYRIIIPTSLRERADAATPAANIMSLAFLNCRHALAVADRRQLLAKVRRETEEIKRTRRGTLFLDGLAIAAALPGALRQALKLPICMSTAVLTNVGDPCRRFKNRLPRQEGKLIVGNLRLTAFRAVPPLRPRTHAALGVMAYAGELSISVQMTPQLFSPDDERRFLGRYVGQLRESMADDVECALGAADRGHHAVGVAESDDRS